MILLETFLSEELNKGKVIYPDFQEIFSAFDLTPFDKVKVVIIGQDPYHGTGQAHGLSFSVKPDVKIPPSLRNIYKELHSDIGFKIPHHGYLLPWARQGVLLLNAVLTVEAHKAGSHQKRGWERFTDVAVKALNDHRENLVFVLWGSFAQKKAADIIDPHKHLILKSVHPSPLSASRGFFGCCHFSKINDYLIKKDIGPIDWTL